MFKPDALRDGLPRIEKAARTLLAEHGLTVTKITQFTVNEEAIIKLWPYVPKKILLERLEEIRGMILPVWVVRGDRAVRKLMAIKRQLRQMAKKDGWYNKHFQVCHTPSSTRELQREWGVFFPGEQLPK